MTKTIQYKIALLLLLAGSQTVFAQKKDENLGTEVVNVVKPYTPTISDAFKVKETPTIEDEDNTQKKEIQYNIFSFPVASTFTPSKGKAAGVDKAQKEKLYNNYATLGFGNYAAVNGELFITQNLNNNEYVAGMLRHMSSQGGIKDVLLDDKYSNTSLDLTYGSKQRDFDWNADLGYQHQLYNWYGLPTEFLTFDDNAIAAINPQQTYQTLKLGARLGMKDSYFNEASLQFKRFWDAKGSAENRFFVKPAIDFEFKENKFKADFVVDYVGGNFEKDYFNLPESEMKYSYLTFGVQPSILLNEGDLSVQAGAGLFYNMGKLNNESEGKFYIYPQVKASYKVVGDVMIAYAGAEGGLKQNTYADFVGENQFVAPNLIIAPTSEQYDIYVGLKGKLANNVAYNVRGSYKSDDDKAFFKSNTYDTANTNTEGYVYGNSFGVVYDKLKTISFFGELKIDFSKNVTFGINGTFNSFTTDLEQAWNMPTVKVGADFDFNITEKWYAGTNVFFVGERKDQFMYTDVSLVEPQIKTVTLDSYFDLNAHVGYKHNERLTAFLKANNLASQNYQRWLNYPVQGFQFLIGASYKFDF